MKNDVKRVLYLSYTGMTDPLGQSQVLAYLKGLSETGEYQFTIISFEKPEAFKKNRRSIEQFCKEAGILWLPLNYTSKPPVLSTFWDLASMKKLAFQLAKQQTFYLVHCRSYLPSLVGLQLKKKSGIPFLFDMRGFWADERIDGGIWRKSNPLFNQIYLYFKRKEKQFLLQADQVISLTRNARDVIHSWGWSARVPITVIPCCVDTELFDPQKIKAGDQERARKEMDIPEGVPVISYIGSLGTWYMLNEMMDFVKVYQQAYKNSIFMVLTGEPEQLIADAALRAGVPMQSIRIKKVPRTEMPLYISLSTTSIFFIKPAFSKKASSPVKQAELMAMGIPVICNDAVGDTAEIVKQYEAGVVVHGFTETDYQKAIQTLASTNFDREKIITGAKSEFLLEKGIALYRSVYKQIGNE